jgi:4-amino-4-deoxy-L-arabinose transferase-like glycosyltransferase
MNRSAWPTGGMGREPKRPGPGVRAASAVVIAVAMLAYLVPELARPGVTWDEPEYFASVERIQAWFSDAVRDPAAALERDAILKAWDPPEHRYYNPHPPVYKEGMAITEAAFGKALGPVAGYRLSSGLLFALLAGVVAWTVSGVAGLWAGVGAALSLALMPRVFGHAHIAATDLPLTCFWTLCVLAFASYLRDGGGGPLLVAAVALGLSLGTKFNGWLLPVPLLIWAILERHWIPWVVTVGLGLLIAWIAVPPAWHDPVSFVIRLFEESLARDDTIPIQTLYAGNVYDYAVPWHQPIVMLVITVPIGIACLSLLGSTEAVRSREVFYPRDTRAALARLSLLQIGFLLAVVALPASPNHDGVRLFLPVFPFVAILAGLALGRFEELLRPRFPGPTVSLGMLLLMATYLVPAWWQERQVSPYYLSWYSEWIGGLSGAKAAGMEISYWYDAVTPEFISEVQQVLPENATVLAFPSVKYFEELQRLGLLRSDLRFSDRLSSGYLLMIARKATLPPALLEVYETVRPLRAVELDGVELAGLYVLNGMQSAQPSGTGD